ncbi:hypothetical protein ENSA5_51540 [Enhygromyxa salina]|uniref:Uncharacterized protein n=1 Tax=Enhygromyxa salina TaxID=215803 RepID=A0A2S9XGV8_9BACT|nr:hypothetical protein [Enhygromyxa salina]PRP92114.1 hypothetical protein ENSA5_51540 [Enhygromyxa salina]
MTELANRSAVEVARQLAAAHPDATLPCPLCPATVKAENLERHLTKVHAAELQTAASETTRWSGADKGIVVPMIGLLVAWGVGLTVAVALGVPIGDLGSAIVGGACLVAMGLSAAAVLGVFKARLELDGDRLRLRWLFGLGSRSVALPAKLESGRLVGKKLVAPGLSMVAGQAEDKDMGAYLRLSSGGSTITVGANKAAGLAKHWAQKGWSRGPKARLWSITVDRSVLVALEYQLAARGQLKPRE